MPYLLDSNVFIEAKSRYYGMDICPGFWDWIKINRESGKVFSIDKVGYELKAINDGLAEWTESYGEEFFLPANKPTLDAYAKIANWVAGEVGQQKYTQAAMNTFLQNADYYLISYALANQITVVTQERPADTKNIVKIPNVCLVFGVKCVNTFDMLRTEKVKFVI